MRNHELLVMFIFANLGVATSWTTTTLTPARQPKQQHRHCSRSTFLLRPNARYSSSLKSSSSSEEVERLKESASKLRQEAAALREQLGETTSISKDTSTAAATSKPIFYKELSDSVWRFTYRFSSEPEPREKEPTTSRTMYGGKLSLRFRKDGYTDLLSHEPTGATALKIEKVWGWDEETSNDDNDLQYVLFSVNAVLSEQDMSDLAGEPMRFYWQAQVERDRSELISLTDGTVTIKKDVKPPGGFWGVFDGGGILAQVSE
jgi:hypothetical protein